MLKHLSLLLMTIVLSPFMRGQDQVCCDIDSYDFTGFPFACIGSPAGGDFDGDGQVCDPDCGDFDCYTTLSPLCNDLNSCNYNWSGEYPWGAEVNCQYIPEGACDCDGNVLDECGVCGGDGIAEGACDCDGYVLDECGVCGGDGIAEGACDCDGNVLDECGVCGGDGIAEGACDCDGNVLDECGVCGGDGIAEGACDCDGNVFDECGLCDGNSSQGLPYFLSTEVVQDHIGGELDGMTTYRVFLNCLNETDYLAGVYGYSNYPLVLESSSGSWYNDIANTGWNAQGINPAFYVFFPDLAYDSFLTIGAEDATTPPAQQPFSAWGDIDASQQFLNEGPGYNIVVDDETGGAWYTPFPGLEAAGSHVAFAGEDLQILIAQFTTAGTISGQLSCQIFLEGNQECEYRPYLSYPSNIAGCTDEEACNYAPLVGLDDGSCLYLDACGVCGGPGEVYDCGCADIPEGECDCEGNVLDVCGVCGGDSVPGCNDPNACNYSPEADCDVNCIYVGCPQFGCTDEEACNYNDSADFEDGSCEYLSCGGCTIELACNYDADAGFDDGSCDFITCLVFGCTDANACNYDATAQFNDGGCTYPNFPYDCQGACQSDSDGDGICDPLEIEGCTNPLACNFSSGATDDDGSCEFGCAGCTNVLACNYNPGATADDGSCDFLSCNGVGCIDVSACNYDANASINDGSCIFPPLGDCDCSGNQLDVLGVCGGDCTEDANANGVCDNAEILGCTLEAALNFNANANVEDGSCVLITDLPEDLQFVTTPNSGLLLGTITVDDLPLTEPALLAAFNPQGACVGWNMLVQAEDQTVVALAIYGDDPTTPLIDGMVPGQAFTLQLVLLNSAVTLTYGENPAIEIEGWVNTNGTPIPELDNVETEYPFLYLTACEDAAACNYNPGSEGVEDCQYPDPELDCNGDCLVDTDSDGVCDAFEIFGCTNVGACNYDELATEEDGSCLTLDVCGVCGGAGIPEGDCDCNGNQLDALGECGGTCAADIDTDGLCDDIDDCVGSYDGCGVCNGPGAIYECGCTDILEGDCDCNGNQLDALSVCGGDCDADEDADGICDDVDDCVGAYDECGVCNGFGAIYECGCADIPAGTCDCDGNLLDALGICNGDCAADVDADGICDDVDDCIGGLMRHLRQSRRDLRVRMR